MALPERAMEMEAYSVQPENTATISLKTQNGFSKYLGRCSELLYEYSDD